MKFLVGDLVRLTSGGPLMTVEQIGRFGLTTDEAVWCTWFETVGDQQVVRRDTFSPFVIEKAERPGLADVLLGRA